MQHGDGACALLAGCTPRSETACTSIAAFLSERLKPHDLAHAYSLLLNVYMSTQLHHVRAGWLRLFEVR